MRVCSAVGIRLAHTRGYPVGPAEARSVAGLAALAVTTRERASSSSCAMDEAVLAQERVTRPRAWVETRVGVSCTGISRDVAGSRVAAHAEIATSAAVRRAAHPEVAASAAVARTALPRVASSAAARRPAASAFVRIVSSARPGARKWRRAAAVTAPADIGAADPDAARAARPSASAAVASVCSSST